MAEARTGTRFPLHLSTVIKGAKASARLQGETSDLSAAGVYIQADGDFEIGSNIEFEITLPADVIGAKKDVAIRCKGRVVRSAAAGKKEKSRKNGVACVIDQYEFVRK